MATSIPDNTTHLKKNLSLQTRLRAAATLYAFLAPLLEEAADHIDTLETSAVEVPIEATTSAKELAKPPKFPKLRRTPK